MQRIEVNHNAESQIQLWNMKFKYNSDTNTSLKAKQSHTRNAHNIMPQLVFVAIQPQVKATLGGWDPWPLAFGTGKEKVGVPASPVTHKKVSRCQAKLGPESNPKGPESQKCPQYFMRRLQQQQEQQQQQQQHFKIWNANDQ